jgi:ribosomal protein S12 methylthiotransferase accessory factor
LVPTAELLPVAEREARRLGTSRLTDLEGLDILGVPCWQATRPLAVAAPGNITVLTGKAWDRDEARLGAVMESIERHWAEQAPLSLVMARPSRLAERGVPHIHPDDVPLPVGMALADDPVLAWAWGTTLSGAGGPEAAATLVPAHEVLCPFTPPPETGHPPVWRSAGLAAGASMVEAVLFGLLEVVERDAVAVAEVARQSVSVDLDACPSPRLAALRVRLADHGVALEVKRLEGIGGVPVFAACLDDRKWRDPMGLVAGYAAHPDELEALEGAVLEAVQTRLTVVAGAREDLDGHGRLRRAGYQSARQALSWWLDPTEARCGVSAVRQDPPTDPSAALSGLLADLGTAGFDRVVTVALSPPGAAVAVARVVVPGASHICGSAVRLGRRLSGARRS